MLLEIENQLHRRVHGTIGQSAVVLRLAEELDKSGRVAEQTMIIISYSGENTNNPNKGAYIPTVRNRSLNYSITLIQKQVQREGHSFALPLMDLIYDAVTGWVPEVPGLEFQTGFEPGAARFVQVTEASQFIYEMNFTVEVILADGRFYSQPCAAFDPVSIDDFLPQRSCLLTPEGRKTGLAIWRRKTGADTAEEFVVEEECDRTCSKELGDLLEVTCGENLNGDGTYRFISRTAISVSESGQTVIDESKVLQGSIKKVWKCYKDKKDPCPQWFKLNIDTGLWRNTPGTVPNTDPLTSARQDFKITTKSARLSENP
jgi:hypothetical protein